MGKVKQLLMDMEEEFQNQLQYYKSEGYPQDVCIELAFGDIETQFPEWFESWKENRKMFL